MSVASWWVLGVIGWLLLAILALHDWHAARRRREGETFRRQLWRALEQGR
jgi:hypothetical protein